MGKLHLHSSRFANSTEIYEELNIIPLGNTTFTKDSEHIRIHNLHCSRIGPKSRTTQELFKYNNFVDKLDVWPEDE